MKTIRFFLFLSAMLVVGTSNAQFDLETKSSDEEWQFSRFFREEKFVSDFVQDHTGIIFLSVVNDSRIEELTIKPLLEYKTLAKEANWAIPYGPPLKIKKGIKSVKIPIGILHYTFAMSDQDDRGVRKVTAGTTLEATAVAFEVIYTLNGERINSIFTQELKEVGILPDRKNVALKAEVVITDELLGLRDIEEWDIKNSQNLEVSVKDLEGRFSFIIRTVNERATPSNIKIKSGYSLPTSGEIECLFKVNFRDHDLGSRAISGNMTANFVFSEGTVYVEASQLFPLVGNPNQGFDKTRKKNLHLFNDNNQNEDVVLFFLSMSDEEGVKLNRRVVVKPSTRSWWSGKLKRSRVLRLQPGQYSVLYYRGNLNNFRALRFGVLNVCEQESYSIHTFDQNQRITSSRR